ncbi:hypothetical protein NP493_466g07030 [Ridgeia piscesae]|uniref:C2H2-type domain-containing protein n=1 Tax=Ridgeia piscesae TaxID=27915 RepID=A0AAD9NRQ5_RIDPI|nr:hypothetical protein NP493_466g07030 [Ridgeia piscesae]
MGAAQSGLLGNSPAQNGRVDLARLRSALREQSQQDPTKQQLYALLLEEYTSTDDEKDDAVSHDIPHAPALMSREGTPTSKTDMQSHGGDNDVTRKLSPDCSRDGDSASKASDSDSSPKTPSEVGDAPKISSGGSLDDKLVVKPTPMATDGLSESRKRSHCTDIVAPKKKFLHGFRNRSNSMNVDQSDSEAKVVPASVTSSSSSSSTPTPQLNGNLESRSNSGSGTPETPGGQSNGGSVSMPTAMPNNLRIRNIIETLMNTDMIRRHLEYDGPEHEIQSLASTNVAKSIDTKNAGSEEGSPRPLEPQTIQNQMQKALLLDTHSPSPSGDVAKPLALREHAGPLQLIKEQVISISPGIECQTSTSGASYRIVSSVGQLGDHRSGEHGAVMSSVPAEIKQNRAQLAYSVQSSQMMPTHPQFVGHARQYQPAGIATGRSVSRSSPAPKPVTGGSADPYGAMPPGGAPWISRKSVLAGMGDPARQPYERFHPGEDRVVEGHPRDAQWLDGRQQDVSQGCVNICPQIVDKNMTMTSHQTLPPGSVYRTHTGGSLSHGCSDVAAAKSLMLQQEAVGIRNEAGVVYDRRLISPRSRYEGARHSHEMLNHPGAVQQLGCHMQGGAGSSPMSRVPPHAPELQRSPPGMYHAGCSGHAGCHGCSSVTSVRQPVVTSRPHSRYDMTRWELTHQHELPSRMPQQRASPVRAPHRESPGSVSHHRSPIPGIELSQPSEIVQPVSGRGPPPLIPLTASQASYIPPEFRQRCLSQSEGHHRNGSGAKPWQERKPEKESPLDLSGRKEQYVVLPRSEGTGADVNIPLDLSVRNAPVVAPPPPATVEDGHFTKREVGQSFVHPQQITPAGDVGTTQRGNSNPTVGFPNMSQHIMKLQQSINRTIQDIDEPAARCDPPSHPNQLHRQNMSPENTLMKQYPNMAGVTHHPPPPLWHMPPGGVPREYPSDTQRHNLREVKMLVPPPAIPPGKTVTQKTSFRYGTVNILGNHPPNDILFLRCNLCGLTYGSQHSIKKHFNKVHGRDPTPDAVTVQTISDMRNAISQAGEKLAKEHQDKVDKMNTSPGSKNEVAPEQNHRSNDGHCKKPEQNMEQKPEEKRPAEGERQKKREQDAKNCQALSPQRKSSPRVARAPLVKCDGDSDNHSDNNVDGEKSMMKCLQCGQDFPTRDWGVFRRHVRTHDLTPDAIYKCSVCSVGFRDAAKRRTHMSTAHSITSCMCRKCNIGFTHIGALNKHLKTAHMDGQRVDVEYRCLYCPKYFAVQDDMMLHTQRHETPDDNTDTAVAAKPAKDKTAVLVVKPPSRHATPDTSNDKFPYPDLTIVEDPIVIANDSPKPPAVRNTVSLPWKPMMSHHVPTGKTLQEMLMEKIEPQANDRKEEKLVNGTNVPPALVCAQKASQGDDVKMPSSMASHDQNMKRRLDTQVPATEQLMKKVKPEDTPLPKLTTTVDEQAIQTAQRLLKDIVKTANSGMMTATTMAESLRDKESKVSHIMQGVLRSFPVLRHKPENIREVIETLVTAELTGELPQRFATDTMEDATNDSENTSSNQQVAARQGNEMDEVRSGSVPTVSLKDSNETVPKTSGKATEKTTAAEDHERDTTLWEKSRQDSSVHTKTSVPPEKDLHDIPAKDSVSAIYAPTRFPEKTASEKALENKSYLGMTVLEAYVPKKAGDYRKSGKSYAKPAKCTETSLHRHAASSSATPSTSGSFNPLRALQFTEFHPTLCTDHACEGNYLEKLHDHGHCHNRDEEDVSKKGKLDDTDSGPDKTSLRPCTDGPCDRPVEKTSVSLSCTDGPCDKSHSCKSALVGTSSGDASSTVVSDVD